MTADIVFIKVTDNKTKIWRLCECIKQHFLLGDKLLLVMPHAEAAIYMDELLWRLPEESFLPHQIINAPSNERIAISLSHENLNQATVIFNLQPDPFPHFEQYKILYEFYDETHPTKTELSQRKLSAYPSSRFLA